MTHLELENLVADYLDGALDDARRAQAEAHLAFCTDCREMIENVRFAITTCQAASDLEPAPRLFSQILHFTTGERKPGIAAQFVAWLRPVLRPQVVYGVAMAVFSVSFVLFTAKVNLRHLKVQELDPATWFQRVDSRGHLFFARAQKFYDDLRFVYEVQSVLRELRQQPNPPPVKNKDRRGGNSEAQPLGGVVVAQSGPLPQPNPARPSAHDHSSLTSFWGGRAGEMASAENVARGTGNYHLAMRTPSLGLQPFSRSLIT